MLTEKLDRDESLKGRSIQLAVSATGQVVDAYDMYIDIYGHVKDHYRVDDPEYQSMYRQIFVRLIFWETTHKKIVIGTLTVHDPSDIPAFAIEELEKVSVPIEKKDYWKKTFEKYVVVEFSKILGRSPNLDGMRRMWSIENSVNGEPPSKTCNISDFSVHSCSVASYEFSHRNPNLGCYASEEETGGDGGEPLKSKCWEGTHGFVRSDSADEFDQKPISLPVTLDIK